MTNFDDISEQDLINLVNNVFHSEFKPYDIDHILRLVLQCKLLGFNYSPNDIVAISKLCATLETHGLIERDEHNRVRSCVAKPPTACLH